MELTAIAAVGRNGVIGRDGDVPWHIPEDWRRFKRITMGGSLIMGRKTFEGIGKPLPGRTSIVVSRSRPSDPAAMEPGEGAPEGTRVVWVTSIDEAIAAADPDRPVWVAGGAEIYRLAWDALGALDICEVDQSPEGDAFFPEIDADTWEEVRREPRDGHAFVGYRRRI